MSIFSRSVASPSSSLPIRIFSKRSKLSCADNIPTIERTHSDSHLNPLIVGRCMPHPGTLSAAPSVAISACWTGTKLPFPRTFRLSRSLNHRLQSTQPGTPCLQWIGQLRIIRFVCPARGHTTKTPRCDTEEETLGRDCLAQCGAPAEEHFGKPFE